MTHLAIIGKGAITRALLPLLADTNVERITLLVRDVAAEDVKIVRALFTGRCRCVSTLAEVLTDRPDLMVEAAGQDALRSFGPEILRAGVPLIAASVGALADPQLLGVLTKAAVQGQSRLHLPSGAIGGIDALAALASIGQVELQYTGTKPTHTWPAAAATSGIVFEGTAREAALAYPKNANVAATLALAGPGMDDTKVTLLADPDATGNTHAWTAESTAGALSVTLHNAPVAGNAATSLLTVHSLLRTIRNLTSQISL